MDLFVVHEILPPKLGICGRHRQVKLVGANSKVKLMVLLAHCLAPYVCFISLQYLIPDICNLFCQIDEPSAHFLSCLFSIGRWNVLEPMEMRTASRWRWKHQFSCFPVRRLYTWPAVTSLLDRLALNKLVITLTENTKPIINIPLQFKDRIHLDFVDALSQPLCIEVLDAFSDREQEAAIEVEWTRADEATWNHSPRNLSNGPEAETFLAFI